MNTPESREGNLIRYAIYLLVYLLAMGIVSLVVAQVPIKTWNVVLFVLIMAMALLFYVYRFNREQQFFVAKNVSWSSYFGLIIGLTLVVTVLRIVVSYLQASSKVGLYNFQLLYLKHESISLYWFLIAAVGIFLPILQMFLCNGFLFNYAFRKNTRLVGIIGIIVSGILFSLLNFQMSLILMLINAVFGALFSWSYLYTGNFLVPIYLAVVNGLIMVIMI